MQFIIENTTLENSNFIQGDTPVLVTCYEDNINIKSNKVVKKYPNIKYMIFKEKLTKNKQQQEDYDFSSKLIDKYYESRLSDGVIINGIHLAATEYDQNAFSRMLILFQMIESTLTDDASKQAFQNSIQSIADINKIPHQLPVKQIRQILFRYGIAITEIWNDVTKKRAMLL